MRVRRSALLVASAIVALSLGAPPLHADSLTLTDGTRVEGIVRKTEGGYEVTLADGSRKQYRADQVRSVAVTSDAKPTEQQARDRLASLRRSVEFDTDLNRIIERYDNFVQMNAGTAALAEAKKDLDQWRDRRSKGMVKVGRKWVTPQERVKLYEASLKTIDEIRTLQQAGKSAEAMKLLRAALDEDPANVSYQYLNGVALARRGAWGEAQKAFNEVAQQVGDHAPTLSNRALCAVQTKRLPVAMQLLEQAMSLDPNVPSLVDNAAELLQMVPDAQRKGAIYDKLLQRFVEQDSLLQQQFGQKGLYRWGSGWVPREKLDDLKKKREEYEKQKDDLQRQFDESAAELKQKQDTIRANEETMDRIKRDNIGFDADGRPIRRALPDSYWELDRENQQLKRDIDAAKDRQTKLRRDAADLEKREPNPPFKGSMALIGEDGVPVIVPPPPPPTTAPSTDSTTQPATAPATRDAR
jgi:tetratricopeptide (TPR) repeat protein